MKNNNSKNNSLGASLIESLKTLLNRITSLTDNYDEKYNTDFYYIKSNNALLRNEDNSPRSYKNIDELAKDIPNYKDKFSAFELDNTDSVVLSIPIGTEVTIIPEKESASGLLYADGYGWINSKHLTPMMKASPPGIYILLEEKIKYIKKSKEELAINFVEKKNEKIKKGSRVLVYYETCSLKDRTKKYIKVALEENPDSTFWIQANKLEWEGKEKNNNFIINYNQYLVDIFGKLNQGNTAKKEIIESTLMQIWYVSILLIDNKILSIEDIPFSEPTYIPYEIYAPHQLIEITRKFIQELYSVEQSYENAKQWFYRLRVPQYRSQTDNLIGPEVTCSVTTLAMTLERLGITRNDIINAINIKVTKQQIKKEIYNFLIFEYRKKFQNIPQRKKRTYQNNPRYKKDRHGNYVKGRNGDYVIFNEYKSLRGGNINKKEIKDFNIDSNFLKYAQLEDLIDFYRYLIGNFNRTHLYKKKYNYKIFRKFTNSLLSKHDFYLEPESIKPENFGELKKKVLSTLESGGAVVYSFNHKGRNKSGSHIIMVQSVHDVEFIIDDPYGKMLKDYKKNQSQDAYCPRPQNRRRGGLQSTSYKSRTGRNRSTGDETLRKSYDDTAKDHWKKEYPFRFLTIEKKKDAYKGDSYPIPENLIEDNIKYIFLVKKIRK